MKKVSIFVISIMLVFLVSCTTEVSTTSVVSTSGTTEATTTLEATTNTDGTISITETTTQHLYDDRSLVPDSCNHLENIGDYQPVWCDEFDIEGLPDDTKWGYDIGGGGWGNNELQNYTYRDEDNAYVSDGTLKITAIEEELNGYDYTSARLITKNKGDWLYGKIQVRAKLPSGTGTWPAIWMLPTDWVYGGWPDSGEIDIMEYVGYNPGVVHGTIHTGAYNGGDGTQIGYDYSVPDAETEFHVYEIEWEPGQIRVYIDGFQYGTFGYNPLTNLFVDNTDAWPFDQEFHLLLNIAVGGNWGGIQGVDDVFPTTLEVDYVRVYQKDYAGMDQEAPDAITNLTLLNADQSSIKFYWNKANDDIMVKEYEIYVDSVLHGTTSLNAYETDNLFPGTSYRIDVIAVDFAGNRSEAVTLNSQTDAVRSILDGIVEAESYDSQSGVLTDEVEDEGGGRYVGWIGTDDYMLYTLFVPEDADYTLTFRTASETAGGQIKVYLGTSLLPKLTQDLPVTGGWQVWQSTTTNSFSLNEGVYTFKIKASIGGFNLNYFEFKKVE